ncbi:hypothetical protein OIU79_016518 [Salix purpurea]|uniref:Uncharacterized protein n=1 Tax=Salix purpurea TaxID=77065 RepID=A0A9Q0PES1_SALPP|nr:hypothetical protein OIU79_016518 [Salix purpurea]
MAPNSLSLVYFPLYQMDVCVVATQAGVIFRCEACAVTSILPCFNAHLKCIKYLHKMKPNNKSLPESNND